MRYQHAPEEEEEEEKKRIGRVGGWERRDKVKDNRTGGL